MSESEMFKQPKEENVSKPKNNREKSSTSYLKSIETTQATGSTGSTGSTGEESLKATFVAASGLYVGGDALCASLSEETSLLAVAKADCSVHVLRLKLHVSGANADWTHGETTTLSGHQGAVYLGSFSTDGSQLLTCSTALDMRMWNHTAAITSMAFDRDNFRLAVGSRDAKMSVWDFGAPAMESRASDCGRVLQVRFVNDSHLVGICVNEPQCVGPQEEESIPLPLEAPTGSSGPRDF
ncbi:GL14543 [Drosophila persimilis]|uniref:GL14543 n=1 Tax=Drosophila persimilis TaxID=7234 RepID=B4GQ82_DROPE|nr:GL14543 [Drosophila persimilis]